MLSDVKVRVIAQACLTRYDRGEGTWDFVVDSYNLSDENRALIVDQIIVKRPSIDIEI